MASEPGNSSRDEAFYQRIAIEATLRIALIAGLVVWCFKIMLPFVEPLVWAVVIASATWPLFLGLRDRWLGGRNTLAATLFTLLMLAVVLVPSYELTQSMFNSADRLAQEYQHGEFEVPPPPEDVKTWPVIGEEVYETWSLASENLDQAIARAGPRIKNAARAVVDTAIGAGLGALQLVISIVIAGVFLANGPTAGAMLQKIAVRLAGEQGAQFGQLAGATVRSVAQGVLGVAFIQALLGGIGMLAIGIPGAGIWALLILVLAIIQLPPLLVLGPVIAYAFSAYDTLPATIFAIWSFLVSISDSFLKPMLLGRGVSVPMLVIFIGAIGGFMLTGIFGLFTGSVVFVLGYTLFVTWLDEGQMDVEDSEPVA